MIRLTLIFILTLCTLIMLLGCGLNRIKIEDLEVEKILYYNLPYDVQSIYLNKGTHDDSGEWKTIVCTESTDTCKVKFHSSADYLDLAIYGYSYDIYYKNKTYKIKAPKGHPFVIDKGYFYYPNELNVDKDNYNKIEYLKVKL